MFWKCWLPLCTPMHTLCLWNFFSCYACSYYLVLKVGYLLFDTNDEIRDLTRVATAWTWVATSFTRGLFFVYRMVPGWKLLWTDSGGRLERAFVDVRIFNPFVPSNAASSLSACYKKHENTKKRAYGQKIREIEHASFTAVVMSVTGGLSGSWGNIFL